MKGANQHIGSSLGFSILPKDISRCRPGELNQQSSNNKMLALPWAAKKPLLSQANIYLANAS